MNADYFRFLFDYNYWARDRVLAATSLLHADEYTRANGFTYGSIRGILVHCLSGEWVWRSRFQDGRSPTAPLGEEDIPDFHILRSRWIAEETKMRHFLEGLSDHRLRQPVEYKTTTGVAESHPLWQILAHLANHSTQHRSEAAEALTLAGRSPGDLDVMRYMREKAGG